MNPRITDLKNHYEDQLRKIVTFLSLYKGIYTDEVLNSFPHSLSSYPKEWRSILSLLNDEEQLALENGGQLPFTLNEKVTEEKREHLEELKSLFSNLKKLEFLPIFPSEEPQDYPSWALYKVSGKKMHEIQRIISALSHLGIKKNDHFIEIGGGKGHLSRILCLYHGLNATSLDTNAYFQELGEKRRDKYPHPEGAGELNFILHTFGDKAPETIKREEELFSKIPHSLGLHTCGPLAIEHLRKSSQQEAFLNFGCCYMKCDPERDTNLSHFSQREGIHLSKFALTLASRGHTKINLNDFLLKKRVKYFRSALHLWMVARQEELGLPPEFVTVGSAHAREYRKTFGEYALLKLTPFKEVLGQIDEEELEAFFQQKETQEKLDAIYWSNMIRWRFGRILEKYLLLDRALSLVEQGEEVEVYQFFEEELSPRNIGLFKRKAPL